MSRPSCKYFLAVLACFLLLLMVSLPWADPEPSPHVIRDSAWREEKNWYDVKCRQALQSKALARRDGLVGLAFIVAVLPLEPYNSRVDLELLHAPWERRNRLAFSISLLSYSLWYGGLAEIWRSFQHYQDYLQDHGSCRYAATFWKD